MGKQQKVKNERKASLSRLEAFERIKLPFPQELADDPQVSVILGLYSEAAGRFLDPLVDNMTPVGLRQGTHASLKYLDELLQLLPEAMELPGEGYRQMACTAGCNYCCSHSVTTWAPSVIALAHYLKKKLDPEAMAMLLERMRVHIEVGLSMTPLEQAFRRRMCPLNVDGRCIGYEYRPFPCRGYHSFDVKTCKANMETEAADGYVPHDPRRTARETLMTEATSAVTVALGLNDNELELVPALWVALTEENVAERYLVGEDVFAGAYRPEINLAEEEYQARKPMQPLSVIRKRTSGMSQN
jgi:hypothetical protein